MSEPIAPMDEFGCRVWQGALDAGGYPIVWRGRRPARAHRVVYEREVGPVPEGKVLDHACRNRACVRPDHLEPVTHAENVRRSEGVSAIHGRKTHCDAGHPFSEENTRIKPDGGRVCRTCHRHRERDRFHRTRAPRLPAGTDVQLKDGTTGTVTPK